MAAKLKHQANIVNQENRLMVSGDLDFETVTALWRQSLALLARSPELQIDFTQVTAANSAGLALLIEWLKFARKNKKSIRFTHIPAQLISIADAAGIKKLLEV